ncbi:MAG: PA1571 family protein [Pseudomonas sp.]
MQQQDNANVQHSVNRIKSQRMVVGAIIDAQGREVPITEQMILQACRELEKSAQSMSRRA